MPFDEAHPAAAAIGSNASSASRRLPAVRPDDIDTLRDLELERLVAQTDVLAVVGERERGSAARLLGGRERTDLQRVAIDDEHEPIIITLLAARIQAQRP